MIRWARIPAVYRAQRSHFFLHFSCTLLFMDEELASGTSNEISSSIFSENTARNQRREFPGHESVFLAASFHYSTASCGRKILATSIDGEPVSW